MLRAGLPASWLPGPVPSGDVHVWPHWSRNARRWHRWCAAGTSSSWPRGLEGLLCSAVGGAACRRKHRRGDRSICCVRAGSNGTSILDMLSSLDEDVEPSSPDDGGDDAWRVIEEELLEKAKETRERHRKAMNIGYSWGHVPVLLVPSMSFLFPPHCLAGSSSSKARKDEEEEDSIDGSKERELYDGLFVDCTFGRGGFSKEILSHLSEDARLVAFDIDPYVVSAGQQLEEQDPRFSLVSRPFSDMAQMFGSDGDSGELADLVREAGPVQGVVFDIGISTPQQMQRHRGFSLSRLGIIQDSLPDMRMNPTVGKSASEWLQDASVEELAWVLQNYGADDETPLQSERLAQVILDDQKLNGPYTSMARLAEVAGREGIEPGQEFQHTQRGVDHPARLAIQAIRLWLNSELEELERGMEAAFKILAPGGRCIVNTFKRKEAAIVKSFIERNEDPDAATVKRLRTKKRLVELYPLAGTDLDYSVRYLGKTQVAYGEKQKNNSARSGTMFAMEKAPRTCPRAKVKPRKEAKRFLEPERQPLW